MRDDLQRQHTDTPGNGYGCWHDYRVTLATSMIVDVDDVDDVDDAKQRVSQSLDLQREEER